MATVGLTTGCGALGALLFLELRSQPVCLSIGILAHPLRNWLHGRPSLGPHVGFLLLGRLLGLLVGLGGRTGDRILVRTRVLIGRGDGPCLVWKHSGISGGAVAKKVLDLVMGHLCWLGVAVTDRTVRRLIGPIIVRCLGHEIIANDVVSNPVVVIAHVRFCTAVTPRAIAGLRAWLGLESTGESVWRARPFSGGSGYIGVLELSSWR